MFSESAHLYDAIYGAFKDYAAETGRIATLVRAESPAARTVLDVACGTGEHVRHLRAAHGFLADGLDLDPKLLAIARTKVPEAQFFEADMADFDLARRYDVVLCLFSAIGYLRTLERVTATLTAFRRHLADGGVVIVEPWFTPGFLKEGPGTTRTAEFGGLQVVRTSHTTLDDRHSRVRFRYRLEDASGTRELEEDHELGLFTPSEMLASFAAGGLEARHDPEGLTGRGLYVARAAVS